MVVVGGGAAGLSAALVLGRARRRVAVVDGGAPRNAPAAHMHGFLSRDGMPPADLLAVGREEAADYGVDFIEGQVVSIEPGFSRHPRRWRSPRGETAPDRDRSDRRATRRSPGSGSAGVRTSSTAPTATAGKSAISRSGCSAPAPARSSTPTSSASGPTTSIFFTHTHELTEAEREQLEARGIRVVDGEVRGLVVEDDQPEGRGARPTVEPLSEPRCSSGPSIRPRLDGLLEHLGCEPDDLGFVRVDTTGRTSVPGVWAAGQRRDPRAQVITAAGEGSAAAIAINADLVEEDIARPHRRRPSRGRTEQERRVQMTKASDHRPQIPPPSKHQLALMIWLCVFPTLTVINLAFGDWLDDVAGHRAPSCSRRSRCRS